MIRTTPTVALLVALLPACTLTRDGQPVSPAAYDGSGIATTVASPFYAVAKGAVCVAGATLGSLSSAAIALTDRPDRYEQRASIHESIGRNCRGAYYLPPAY